MIPLKSLMELEKLRISNQIVAEVLQALSKIVAPGITTAELDAEAEKLILFKGGNPSFKGYLGYPNTLCASVNSEVVHGIPSKRKLKDGDIISLDVGVVVDGYYGDAAVTLPVGEISPQARKLLQVTERALTAGIEQMQVGKRIGDISWAIQSLAEKSGFSVVKAFVGHGIGRRQHEEPQVPNYGLPGRGYKLKPGMVLAIEPMINLGTSAVKILSDQWTAVTRDNKLSAHFEHTVAVTFDGPQILSETAEPSF